MTRNIKILLSLLYLAFLTATPLTPAHADIEPTFTEPAHKSIEVEDMQETKTSEEKDIKEDSSSYLLDTGDQLKISVFGVEELSGEFKIDGKGHITMPLIGEIAAKGIDKQSLENQIAATLIKGGYYNNPKVTIEIISMKPFYILGEVKNPGSYDYEDGLDVFKAIAIAGGYTPRAKTEYVVIIRKIDGKNTKIKATESTEILPGDSIKVKQRFF